jgi:CheY-like chemotaxis protein
MICALPTRCGPTGSEALEVLRTTPIDLVTLDLNMPGLQGEELMRVIRREFQAVEVIVITGYGSVDSAVEGLRYGICDYIQKPFDVVKVLSAVSRGLGSRQGRAQLTAFLERLGQLVGRAEDVQRILGQIERSPRLQRRVDGPGGARGQARRRRKRCVGPFECWRNHQCQQDFMRGLRSASHAGLCDRLTGARPEHVRLAATRDVGRSACRRSLAPGALD